MGVAVAIPRAKYEVVDVDLERISHTKSWPKAPEVAAPAPSAVETAIDSASLFASLTFALPIHAWKWLTGGLPAGGDQYRKKMQDNEWDGAVRAFRQKFTLKDAISSHACSLEALACV
jgi:hypothetical protein